MPRRSDFTGINLLTRGSIDKLFDYFDNITTKVGYFARDCQIVDATVVAGPRQRNNGEVKADIKVGKIPQDCQDKPAKLAKIVARS